MSYQTLLREHYVWEKERRGLLDVKIVFGGPLGDQIEREGDIYIGIQPDNPPVPKELLPSIEEICMAIVDQLTAPLSRKPDLAFF